jgi:hypothetical protein
MFCEEWGYDYVKIDGQWVTYTIMREHAAQLHDPTQNPSDVYRAGLAQMKQSMGPSRFLLNCGSRFDSTGLCEGIRIGQDVSPSAGWKGIENALLYTKEWLFANTYAFYTDPDVVGVRETLTQAQAQAWADFVGITGQLLMTSDIMYKLPPSRLEILRRIYPVADIHPMELYPIPRETPPIWNVKVNLPDVGTWDVAALFNWSESSASKIHLSPSKLGLEEGVYLAIDGREGKLLHHGRDGFDVKLEPTSSRIVSLWKVEGRPQFVGTNRHLTQGAVDVESLRWDESTLSLSGVSHVVQNDSYRVRFYVPEGFRVLTEGVTQKEQLAELVIQREQSERVEWRVQFARLTSNPG